MPLALSVVLLSDDMARGAILRRANPGPFLFRHNTVGLRLFFHLVDISLLCVSRSASRSFSFPFAIL